MSEASFRLQGVLKDDHRFLPRRIQLVRAESEVEGRLAVELQPVERHHQAALTPCQAVECVVASEEGPACPIEFPRSVSDSPIE